MKNRKNTHPLQQVSGQRAVKHGETEHALQRLPGIGGPRREHRGSLASLVPYPPLHQTAGSSGESCRALPPRCPIIVDDPSFHSGPDLDHPFWFGIHILALLLPSRWRCVNCIARWPFFGQLNQCPITLSRFDRGCCLRRSCSLSLYGPAFGPPFGSLVTYRLPRRCAGNRHDRAADLCLLAFLVFM